MLMTRQQPSYHAITSDADDTVWNDFVDNIDNTDRLPSHLKKAKAQSVMKSGCRSECLSMSREPSPEKSTRKKTAKEMKKEAQNASTTDSRHPKLERKESLSQVDYERRAYKAMKEAEAKPTPVSDTYENMNISKPQEQGANTPSKNAQLTSGSRSTDYERRVVRSARIFSEVPSMARTPLSIGSSVSSSSKRHKKKHSKRCKKSCRSKSKSVRKHCCRDGTKTFYLPNFANQNDNPVLQSVGFHCARGPKISKPIYTFTVSWTDTNDAAMQKWKRLTTEPPLGTDSTSDPKDVTCDGPCGRKYPAGTMIQYGVCDHNICADCHNTQQSVPLFDGSPGCCNKECLRMSLIEGVLDEYNRKKRKRASQLGSPFAGAHHCCSKDSADTRSLVKSGSRDDEGVHSLTELLFVKITILEKPNDMVIRRRLDYELPSNYSISHLFSIIQPLVRDLQKCKVYFTSDLYLKHKSQLTPLLLTPCGRGYIRNLAGRNSALWVIVAAEGVHLFK